MKNPISQYLARRRWAASWSRLEHGSRRSHYHTWWERHLVHHRLFRWYMRQAATLQRDGFRL